MLDQQHQPYPWRYVGATLMIVPVRCNPEVLLSLVDDRFTVQRPDRAIVWTLDCDRIAGPGSYRELMMNVQADVEGQTLTTTPFIYVDNDAAVASGREVLGLPKRQASLDNRMYNDQRIGRAIRSGVEFLTLGMTLDSEGSDEDIATTQRRLSATSGNFIGDRLVTGTMTAEVTRLIHGRGFIDTRASASDPVYQLQLEAVGSATLAEVNLTLNPPTA